MCAVERFGGTFGDWRGDSGFWEEYSEIGGVVESGKDADEAEFDEGPCE